MVIEEMDAPNREIDNDMGDNNDNDGNNGPRKPSEDNNLLKNVKKKDNNMRETILN